MYKKISKTIFVIVFVVLLKIKNVNAAGTICEYASITPGDDAKDAKITLEIASTGTISSLSVKGAGGKVLTQFKENDNKISNKQIIFFITRPTSSIRR